ncbi:MAG: hypothetical protein PHD48_09660 [Alphaproteobacteria bacterium]|nr:hypothetical protein [Alphaproteobacteria bacterium]
MQCKLCNKEYSSLEESHYISAAAYKALRDASSKNPNPYQLTHHKAVQSSTQVTAQLLCRACEERLSRNGENWTLRNFLRGDGRFKLDKILNKSNPVAAQEDSPSSLYCASKIPEIDVSALAYFAISIFWRGSTYAWTDEGHVPVPLGPYGEQFRQYLMDQAPFPENAALWAIVRQDKNFNRAICFPWGGRNREGHYGYNFSIPGLAFTLLVGKSIPRAYKKFCFINGDGHPLIATTLVDQLLLEHATKMKKGVMQ